MRHDCNAYRVYDRDIPEYAVSVDYYAGFIVVHRYFSPQFVERDDAHFVEVIWSLKSFFDVEDSRIFVKERSRQKGHSQYERLDHASVLHRVKEYGLTFIVNLSDYLDTGLFLDHRLSRYWVQKNSANLRVLNLFCYTGSVSVHAAAGGAKRVVSVDLSSRYLNWARDNFSANQFKSDRYEFVKADVCQWLRSYHDEFDLIFLDPPSFSNSKKMTSDFDVQRDHYGMITDCLKLLAKGGKLFFSNNLRSFKLDGRLSDTFLVQDVSQSTIPPDFHNQLIHKAWVLSRRPDLDAFEESNFR